MAEPSVAKNKERVMMKIMSLIAGVSNEADKPVGAATRNRIRSGLWVGTASPNTSAPTGVSVGDLCLDRTNDEVYRYTSASQWDQMTTDT